MNTKSSMKSLLYRAATVFMIATMLFAAMPVNPINAAAVTYNFQPDTGTTVATGVVTNDADCATSSKVTTTTLMNMDAFGCTSHIIGPTTSGAQTILNVWFNTAFTSDTTVTGTSLKIRLREFSTAGGTATPWTAGIMLMYVNASGTITDFTGTEVTQVVEDASDANYTFSLTDQSATVPSGSKLGIRIRAIESTSTNMRVYYGSTASTIGGTRGVLIVDEKQVTTLTVAAATGTYAGTTDLLATLTDSEGSPISGETISFTLNGSSVGSIATDASGVASLTGISLTGVNAGNYPTGVAASFAGDTNYVASTGTNSWDVSKATPTLSVTNSPVIYNGSPQAATVVGSVAGVVSDIQYDGSATVPTNATTYTVTADFVPTDTINYNSLSDASAGDFVIDKATPTISVTNSPVSYTGSSQAATVVGSVAGVVSDIQYDGSATVPANAGTYAVTADFLPTDTINYNSLSDASAGDFVINKATPTLSVTNSPVTYNGSPQAATVAASVDGVVSNIQYDGSATVPTNVGTYLVTAGFVPTDTTNYNSLSDVSAGSFVVSKATPTLSVTNSPVIYNGSPQAATVVGSVAGVVSDIQYDGSATVPTNATTYTVTADFVPTDTINYNSLSDASAGDFVIDKATPTISVTNSPVSYTGSSQAATVVGSVAGVVSDIQYDGSATVPANAGTYAVTADFLPTDTINYNSLSDASAGDFVINKATPTLSVTNSPVTYNGSPQAATVAASVDGVVSNIQYDGSATVPTNVGTYLVTAGFVPTDTTNYNSLSDVSAGSFVVSKATPTLSVTNSPVTYNGSPQAATVVGSVAGVVSDIQYDGSATVPTNATTYTVIADFVPTDTTNYNSLTDASAGDFVIDKATPTLSVTNSPVTYNGSPQAATVVGSVAGVVSDIQYDASAIVPTNAGTYAVTADFLPTDTLNYNSLSDASAGDFVINKATPTLSVTNSPVIYNGSPQAATVVGSVAGVVSDIQYDGSATVPTNATTYTVTADFVPTDTINYNSLSDASAGDFVIDKATPTISVTNSPITYNGSPQAATVAGSVAGVVSDIQYDGSPTTPTNT